MISLSFKDQHKSCLNIGCYFIFWMKTVHLRGGTFVFSLLFGGEEVKGHNKPSSAHFGEVMEEKNNIPFKYLFEFLSL